MASEEKINFEEKSFIFNIIAQPDFYVIIKKIVLANSLWYNWFQKREGGLWMNVGCLKGLGSTFR